MKKSTQTVIIVIGILSILSGIYGFFSNAESYTIYWGIFMGIVLLGSLYFDKNDVHKTGK